MNLDGIESNPTFLENGCSWMGFIQLQCNFFFDQALMKIFENDNQWLGQSLSGHGQSLPWPNKIW